MACYRGLGEFSQYILLRNRLIIYYFPQYRLKIGPWIGIGNAIGGAVGNLVDRILHDGFVTDFISVGNFPVFNIADASISVGVAILILGMWIKEQQEKKQAANLTPTNVAYDALTGKPNDPENHVNQVSIPGSLPGEKPSDG